MCVCVLLLEVRVVMVPLLRLQSLATRVVGLVRLQVGIVIIYWGV